MAQKRKGRPIDPDQKWLSVRQAAKVRGVGEQLMYRHYHDGKIPGAIEMSGRILIPRSWAEHGDNGEAR